MAALPPTGFQIQSLPGNTFYYLAPGITYLPGQGLLPPPPAPLNNPLPPVTNLPANQESTKTVATAQKNFPT